LEETPVDPIFGNVDIPTLVVAASTIIRLRISRE